MYFQWPAVVGGSGFLIPSMLTQINVNAYVYILSLRHIQHELNKWYMTRRIFLIYFNNIATIKSKSKSIYLLVSSLSNINL